MSLLSPESLAVFLSPGELVAIRRQGFARKIVDKRRTPLVATSDKTWEGAAQAFAALLQEFPSCRQVRVTLSSHFVQYLLMPWREDLNDREEELAIARLAFAETYGEAAADWQVRLSDEAPGIPRVAAAVATDLLSALEKAATDNKVKLLAIQPYLSAAANYWNACFKRDQSSWLVVHEEGRLSVALADRGRWRWIRSLRVGADWAASLLELLDNELLLAGIELPPAQALIFAPAMPEVAVPAGSRWSFRSLLPAAVANFSPTTDSHFGFALVGQVKCHASN